MALRWLKLIVLVALLSAGASAQDEKSLKLLKDFESPPAPDLRPTAAIGPKDSLMKAAYLDVFTILSSRSGCSEFYGGPAIAITVLNELVGHVRYGFLPVRISFEMKGAGTYITNVPTGATYRRFAKMTVNYNGAFYKDRRLDLEKTPRVGSFFPNTRPARALILLHEMGHLIHKNGAWLIPDDGRDWWRSGENTRVIERTCREELRSLDK